MKIKRVNWNAKGILVYPNLDITNQSKELRLQYFSKRNLATYVGIDIKRYNGFIFPHHNNLIDIVPSIHPFFLICGDSVEN